MIVIFRLGSAITVPFLDSDVVRDWMDDSAKGGNFLEYLDILTGGALSKATIFSLSITPFINASIIMQLLTFALPPLERLRDEGEEGRKKIDKITAFVALVLAFFMAYAYYLTLKRQTTAIKYTSGGEGIFCAAVIILSFVAGASFVVWMGNRVSDKGIGNGVSLIIFAGIVTRLPDMARTLYEKCVDISDSIENAVLGSIVGVLVFIAVTAISITIIVFVLYVQNAERRIPVQYSKKVIGRQTRGGNRDYIPLKVNMSGVMPVIFTMSLLAVPSIIVNLFFNNSQNTVVTWIKETFTGSAYYYIIYFLLVIAFTFFYTQINFHPVEIANNITKNGGMINGIRSGKPTTDFIKTTAFRLNWVEAFFLVLVCIVPTIIGILTGFQNVWFAGTSVLILTGVANDLIVQVEGELEIRSPKGFLEDLTIKTGRR